MCGVPWFLQMLEAAFKKITTVQMPDTDLGTQYGPVMVTDGSELPSSLDFHWLGVAVSSAASQPLP